MVFVGHGRKVKLNFEEDCALLGKLKGEGLAYCFSEFVESINPIPNIRDRFQCKGQSEHLAWKILQSQGSFLSLCTHSSCE